MKLTNSEQTIGIANAVCRVKGHHIVFVDTVNPETLVRVMGDRMCMQCGATLTEIRGEDATTETPRG
jgi:hypothetical protein